MNRKGRSGALLSKAPVTPPPIAGARATRRVSPFTLSPALFGAVVAPVVALGTVANDLCAPTADPCIVSRVVSATPGSVIDVGQRELQLLGSGAILVSGGDLTLRGRRINTGPSTSLRTSGARRTDPAGSLVIQAQQAVLTGPIDVRGSPAGAVDIEATESIALSGRLQGRTESAGLSASAVTISAPVVFLSGQIELDGGAEDVGGDLSVTADTIALSGSVVVSGGDGGTVDFAASESIVLTATATITANATALGGDGGDIALRSDRLLNVGGRLFANGRNGPADGGGDGGMIVLNGDDGVILPASGGIVRVNGGSPDGGGGEIEIASLFGAVEIHGTVDASGGDSNETSGGAVDISADRSVDIAGSIQARGALGGGGDIEIEAGDWVRVRSGGQVDASSNRSAAAGAVAVIAGSSVEVLGSVLANSAQTTSGSGGAIAVDACTIAVRAGGELRCRGPNGTTTLNAAGAIVVNGTISTGPTGATNRFVFPQEGPQPVTTGASISPPAVLVPDPGLAPCVPLPATPTPLASATPTHSITPIPSLTPTATPSPIDTATPNPSQTNGPSGCAGDCDGSGSVNIAELVRAVNIALGNDDVASCRAADTNGDGRVTINELIQAVNAALLGCGA